MKAVDNTTSFSEVSVKASEWIKRQYTATQGGFRFSPRSPVCLVGSCCAVLAWEILGKLPNRSHYEIEAWASYIQSFQRDDGWFEDPYLEPVEGSPLDSAWLRGHATFLAVMALDALGQQPDRPLEFLDKWRDDDYLYNWIDQLDWTNPWTESNRVEWIGYWLLADIGLTVDHVPLKKEQYPPGFGGLMQWLEDHQDPTTGFWGNPPFGGLVRTFHQMAAAYHHYVFYYATGCAIPYKDRIVDHTLALQRPDSLFAPQRMGGGPCEDLDAVDILANMHRLTEYRRNEIELALARALKALLQNQRSAGAFVYGLDGGWLSRLPSLLKTFFRPWYPPRPRTRLWALRRYVQATGAGAQQYYLGCPRLPFRAKGGDMFSQWFRPLAIAIAASVLGRNHSPVWWKFGFRRQITQGWWPGDSRSTV